MNKEERTVTEALAESLFASVREVHFQQGMITKRVFDRLEGKFEGYLVKDGEKWFRVDDDGNLVEIEDGNC